MNRLNWKLLIAFILLGASLLYIGVEEIKDSKAVAENYDTVTPSNIHVGMIVEGDIAYNFGIYEETYHTVYGIKTGSSDYIFLIPIGSQYMGIRSRTKELTDALDKQTDETISAFQGANVRPSTVHFRGRIVSMGNDDTFYAKEYLKEMGYSETEVSNILCNYIIETVDADNGMKFVGIGALFLLISIFMIATPLRESLQKRRIRQEVESNLSRPSTTYLNLENEQIQDSEMRRNPFEEAAEEDDNWNYTEQRPATQTTESSTGLRLKR